MALVVALLAPLVIGPAGADTSTRSIHYVALGRGSATPVEGAADELRASGGPDVEPMGNATVRPSGTQITLRIEDTNPLAVALIKISGSVPTRQLCVPTGVSLAVTDVPAGRNLHVSVWDALSSRYEHECYPHQGATIGTLTITF